MFRSALAASVLTLFNVSSALAINDVQACINWQKSPDIGVAACRSLLETKQARKNKILRFQLYRNIAMAYFDRPDMSKEAIEAANAAIETDPENPNGYYIRAGVWSSIGSQNRCIADMTTALAREPSNAGFLRFRAHCYVTNNQPELALADAKKSEVSSSAMAFAEMIKAQALFKLGRSKEASDALERGIALEPKDPLNYGSASEYYFSAGDATRAEYYVHQTIKVFPAYENDWKYFANLGKVASLKGDYRDALDNFGKARMKSPAQFQLFDLMTARVYMKEGKPDVAIAYLDDTLRRLDFGNAHLFRAAAYLLSDKPTEAIKDLNRTIELSPNEPSALSMRAEASLRNGDLRTAVSDLDKVLHSLPNYVSAIIVRAHLLEVQGQITESRQLYAKALTMAYFDETDLTSDFLKLARVRLAALPAENKNVSPNIADVPTPEPAAPRQSATATPYSDATQLAAFKMLDTHCARCHQTDKSTGFNKAQSKVAKILDLQALAADKRWVTPGMPLKSSLYFTVLRREMPYDVFNDGDIDKPMPTDAEADALKAWIVSLAPNASVAARGAR